jgi:uncharacterized protein
MIANTFSILPGVGPATEKRLWRLGVFEWGDFLGRPELPGFSQQRKRLLDEHVARAEQAYAAGDAAYFHRLLGQAGAWRLWGMLAGDAVCVDIETDGGQPCEGSLTVVGFYSHGEYRAYVKGDGLCFGALEREFSAARFLVSYFGGGFDLPFLKAAYPALDLDLPHLDLCPAGHRAGLRGGLKSVERQVGIVRDDSVEGLGGYEAVLLWRAHLQGRPGALDTLVSYNREDTANLHTLAGIIYDRLREDTGLPAMLARAAGAGRV